MHKKILAILMVMTVVFGGFSFAPRETSAADVFDNGLAAQLSFAPPTVDTTNVGYGIQRTMRLLETSTVEKKNTVRIAFCGQSITDGNPWTNAIIAYLEFKYPNADIQAVNFGVGGFNTWVMQHVIENDIRSFYPDLVFFYDYGDMYIYENMIRFIRENTVSEVIIQNDHIDIGTGFGTDYNSFTALPAIANRLNCELADVRTNWKKYMDANGIAAGNLLNDTVHLNNQGQALMYEILKQYLVYKPVDEATFDDRINEYIVGKDAKWSGKTLNLSFLGNRIEAVSPSQAPSLANVLVNGKKPSSNLDLWYYSRWNVASQQASAYYLKIQLLKPMKSETWDLQFTKINDALKKDYNFTLTGLKSGNQGSGNTKTDFISNDGSIQLSPNDFYDFTHPTLNSHISFDTVLNGSDQITFNGIEKIASNIPDSAVANTIQIQALASSPPNNIAFRSYRQGFLLAAPRVIPLKINASTVEGYSNKGSDVVVKVYGKNYSGVSDSSGKFKIAVPNLMPGTTIAVTSELEGYKSQLSRIKLPGVLPSPTVLSIVILSSNSTSVSGTATNGASVSVSLGAKTYKTTASSNNGFFKITIPKTKPGTLVKVVAIKYGITSVVKTAKVLAASPKINKVVQGAKTISGTTFPYSVVKISYDGKVNYSIKASSTGAFQVKTKGATMRVGKYVKAYITCNGMTSAITKIRVVK
ncbi:MAG: hypothetical protein WCQ41_00770 [Bacillota bacterium]